MGWKIRSEEQRFWDMVEKTNSCWLWIGARNNGGYGESCLNGKTTLAHKVSLHFHGILPIKGLVIDHLCRIRHCVNPSHMEQVTRGENVLRGIGIAAMNARKTHCKNGHEFTKENTYNHPTQKTRSCRICTNQLKYKHLKKRKLLCA